MTYSISVENIKCGGCANTIKTRINEMDFVSSVEVEIDTGMVTIDGDESKRNQVSAELLRLGYPESGTAEGLKAAAAKAKSFVSCAIGRIDNSNKDS
jgi:copper chaperone